MPELERPPSEIILPDGSIHPVPVTEEPTPEPTPWEMLQGEVSFSAPALEHLRHSQKHLVRATYVEALALRKMAARA
jgi:hypothetical protein